MDTSPFPEHSCAISSTRAEQPIALLGFGAAAWQSAPRDRYIGWTHEQRQRNLPLIVNNALLTLYYILVGNARSCPGSNRKTWLP